MSSCSKNANGDRDVPWLIGEIMLALSGSTEQGKSGPEVTAKGRKWLKFSTCSTICPPAIAGDEDEDVEAPIDSPSFFEPDRGLRSSEGGC